MCAIENPFSTFVQILCRFSATPLQYLWSLVLRGRRARHNLGRTRPMEFLYMMSVKFYVSAPLKCMRYILNLGIWVCSLLLHAKQANAAPSLNAHQQHLDLPALRCPRPQELDPRPRDLLLSAPSQARPDSCQVHPGLTEALHSRASHSRPGSQ